MPTPPFPDLGHRPITAYNRLAQELAALNYTVRFAKPPGTIGAVSRQSLDRAIESANRLFSREARLPRFDALDPAVPVTAADLVLLVARLSAAALAFEERYRHLSEDRGS